MAFKLICPLQLMVKIISFRRRGKGPSFGFQRTQQTINILFQTKNYPRLADLLNQLHQQSHLKGIRWAYGWSPNNHSSSKAAVITINSLLLYIGRGIIILLREKPLRRPFPGDSMKIETFRGGPRLF